MGKNLFKSILHNIGVVLVGFVFAFTGMGFDRLFGIEEFSSVFTSAAGGLLLAAGFFLRLWAVLYFYERRMRVIKLHPQEKLITSGPYRFSRNPLYLGGNVFIFLGAALLLGSPMALVITVLESIATDLFIRREERQLEKKFGQEWIDYKKQVRRWI